MFHDFCHSSNMLGTKISGLISKTFYHDKHRNPVNFDNESEMGNNFPGTNAADNETNNFSGTNPQPTSGPSNERNNFPGLNSTLEQNNFPGANPRQWSEQNLSEEFRYAPLPDSEAQAVAAVDDFGKHDHQSEKEHKQEVEYGNNFPGTNPVGVEKSFWGYPGRTEESGNNFPGANPNFGAR
ncbi:hypothetical protein BROUX41_005366 [Berkeleyomyces rouxiae]|uniref:uncharacterized protein n=1 Tax=Berkeleyomyces rouxiae TaxID=2035830 RepID=UPI003B7A6355